VVDGDDLAIVTGQTARARAHVAFILRAGGRVLAVSLRATRHFVARALTFLTVIAPIALFALTNVWRRRVHVALIALVTARHVIEPEIARIAVRAGVARGTVLTRVVGAERHFFCVRIPREFTVFAVERVFAGTRIAPESIRQRRTVRVGDRAATTAVLTRVVQTRIVVVFAFRAPEIHTAHAVHVVRVFRAETTVLTHQIDTRRLRDLLRRETRTVRRRRHHNVRARAASNHRRVATAIRIESNRAGTGTVHRTARAFVVVSVSVTRVFVDTVTAAAVRTAVITTTG